MDQKLEHIVHLHCDGSKIAQLSYFSFIIHLKYMQLGSICNASFIWPCDIVRHKVKKEKKRKRKEASRK